VHLSFSVLTAVSSLQRVSDPSTEMTSDTDYSDLGSSVQ